jgi:hypothetical protein
LIFPARQEEIDRTAGMMGEAGDFFENNLFAF